MTVYLLPCQTRKRPGSLRCLLHRQLKATPQPQSKTKRAPVFKDTRILFILIKEGGGERLCKVLRGLNYKTSEEEYPLLSLHSVAGSVGGTVEGAWRGGTPEGFYHQTLARSSPSPRKPSPLQGLSWGSFTKVLQSRGSECSPWTTSSSITWELVRKANSQPHPQIRSSGCWCQLV